MRYVRPLPGVYNVAARLRFWKIEMRAAGKTKKKSNLQAAYNYVLKGQACPLILLTSFFRIHGWKQRFRISVNFSIPFSVFEEISIITQVLKKKTLCPAWPLYSLYT